MTMIQMARKLTQLPTLHPWWQKNLLCVGEVENEVIHKLSHHFPQKQTKLGFPKLVCEPLTSFSLLTSPNPHLFCSALLLLYLHAKLLLNEIFEQFFSFILSKMSLLRHHKMKKF